MTTKQGIPAEILPARRRDSVSESVDTKEHSNSTGDSSSTVTSPNPFRGKFYTLKEILAMPDDADWLFPGLLCRGDTLMLFGDSGAGKTFVALDMAFALAAGIPWCNDLFTPTKSWQVLYCCGEGFRGFRQRVKALHAAYTERGIAIQSESLRVVPLVPQLFDRESAFSSKAFMAAHDNEQLPKPDLIIVDTMFRAILGADENSAKDATFVIEALRLLVEHTGAAVMLVHHISRNGAERGSTAYKAAMESAIEVKRNKDERCMICRKLKDGEEFPPQQYTLTNYGDSAVVKWMGNAPIEIVGKTHSRSLGDIIGTMNTSPGKWWTVAELAAKMGKDKPNLTRSLKQAVTLGLLDYREGSGRKNPATYRPISLDREDASLSLSLSDND